MNFAAAIYKPIGVSSSDVVIKCRNALSRAVGAKIKCGHMGTLDPAAKGVLVLGFGKATKLFDYMQNGKKTYIARFEYGKTTDTLDREGEITEENGVLPEMKKLGEVIKSFVGEIDQIPPAYSAVNVNGVRAYKLARKGEDVKLEPKKVMIYSSDISGVRLVENGLVEWVQLKIVCGSGTYIRSLCRDIADKLGVLSYMSYLERTECAGYNIQEAVDMQDFIDDPISYVKPDSEIVARLFGLKETDPETAKKLKYGQSVKSDFADGRYGLKCGDETLGVAVVSDGYIKLETHLWNTV